MCVCVYACACFTNQPAHVCVCVCLTDDTNEPTIFTYDESEHLHSDLAVDDQAEAGQDGGLLSSPVINVHLASPMVQSPIDDDKPFVVTSSNVHVHHFEFNLQDEAADEEITERPASPTDLGDLADTVADEEAVDEVTHSHGDSLMEDNSMAEPVTNTMSEGNVTLSN